MIQEVNEMPKKSETSEKVQLAADELLARGQRPTQQAVRDLIGTGSITTINHALNLWWSELSQRLNRQSEHPALPDPVITAASKLWDQALVYSHASLEKERTEIAQSLKDHKVAETEQLLQLQSDLLGLQQQNNRLLVSNEHLIEEKSSLAKQINEVELLLIKANSKSEELQRVNKQQDIMLSSKQTQSLVPASDDLFQAKIELKVNESIINDLKKALSEKEQMVKELERQYFDQEKANIRQTHRLELVIAQQDVKYTDLKERLEALQRNS
jgi:hypothetical protein